MYRLLRLAGGKRFVKKLNSDGSGVTFNETSEILWQDFLDWREKLPPEEKAKYDLSDQPPEPEPVDVEAEEVKALALAGGNYTMAEATKVLNFLAKRHLGIR